MKTPKKTTKEVKSPMSPKEHIMSKMQKEVKKMPKGKKC